METARHYLAFLQDTMHRRWDNLALADFDGVNRYNYSDLAREIERLHLTFELLGVKPGDKIALCGRNCANWAATFLAIVSYKAVVVSILPDFTGEGIEGLVNHSEAVLLYVGPNVRKKINVKNMPGLKAVVFMDEHTLDFVANDKLKKAFESVDAEMQKKFPEGVKPEVVDAYPTDNLSDLAIINYTSGTTSAPKGVMLTNLNLSGNVDFAAHRIPHRPGDAELSMLPIAHMFGLMYEFLYQCCDGAETYFLTSAPTPSALMKAFAEVHPFMILTVPLVIEKIIKKKVLPVINKPLMKVLWHTPGIRLIIRNKVKESLMQAFGGKLRFLIIGGAALNGEVEQVLKDIKFCYCVGYGMTECAPLITFTPYDEGSKLYSCGQPLKGIMEVKILDPNSEGIGEVVVRGENTMTGYYKNPQATKETFTKDGWLRTGDLGTLDEEGFLYIKGRCKTMLLGPSGQNIYPEEIEAKINNMPYVLESLVLQQEDTRLVALICPDYNEVDASGMTREQLDEYMEDARKQVNSELAAYEQISIVKLYPHEFEKTPKKSIKRFLYTNMVK